MGLDNIQHLNYKSAKERAKYRTALSIKDIAVLVYFNGDERDYQDGDMRAIANKEYIFCWLIEEANITEKDYSHNAIFVFLNQETGEILYKTKVNGRIVKLKSKIKINLVKIKLDAQTQYFYFPDKLHEEELIQLVTTELLLTIKDMPSPPTKEDIARRKKWTEAKQFIDTFIREALIENKISYEPKKEILGGPLDYYIEFIGDKTSAERWYAKVDVNKTEKYWNKHNLPRGDENEVIYNAPAQNIKIEKDILVNYVNSEIGAWLRDIVENTLLAKWLESNVIGDNQITQRLYPHVKMENVREYHKKLQFLLDRLRPYVQPPLAKIGEKISKPDRRYSREYKEKELRKLPYEELSKRYDMEMARIEAEKNTAKQKYEALFVCTQLDFEHWGRQAYWTIEEGAFLLLGRNPTKENFERMEKYEYALPYSALAQNFKSIRDSALRYITKNKLSQQPSPKELILWAHGMQYEIPIQLVKIVFQDMLPNAKPSNEPTQPIYEDNSLPEEKGLSSPLKMDESLGLSVKHNSKAASGTPIEVVNMAREKGIKYAIETYSRSKHMPKIESDIAVHVCEYLEKQGIRKRGGKNPYDVRTVYKMLSASKADERKSVVDEAYQELNIQ